MKDKLSIYLEWILSRVGLIGFIPFKNPVWRIEDVTSVLMHREGQFQTQMFIVPSDVIIPEHTHPNVDSFEVYGGGEIFFTHSGRLVHLKEDITENKNNTCKTRGHTIRVKPKDRHGGTFGKEGGVFFSVQHWLNNVKPNCVAKDYTGKTMGKHHLSTVTFGDAHFNEPLEKKDAGDFLSN
mgnify:FL=1